MALAIMRDPPELMIYPTGLGEPRPLRCDAVVSYEWAVWHPDGRRVVFVGTGREGSRHLYLQPIDGGAAGRAGETPIINRHTEPLPISPDGKHAVVQRADGRFWIHGLEGESARALDALQPREVPIGYDAAGRGLYFINEADLPSRIHRLDLETGERTLWKTLMPPDPTGIVATLPVHITPDGSAYAYSYTRLTSDLHILEGIE